MAARVNKKLVVILLAIVVVLGVSIISLSYVMLSRTAERYVAEGNSLKAAGEWREAAKAYERAVGKENGNVAYMDLWLDALRHIVPEDRADAEETYQWMTQLLRSRASVDTANASLHLDWLNHLYQMAQISNNSSEYARLGDAAEDMLRSVTTDDPKAYLGRRYRGIAIAYQMMFSEMTAQQRDQAKSDLTEALAKNPDDSDAFAATLAWYKGEARIHRNRSRNDEMELTYTDAIQFATKYTNNHQQDALAWLRFAQLRATASATVSTQSLPDRNAVIELLTQGEAACYQQKQNWRVAQQIAAQLPLYDSETGATRALKLISHLLTENQSRPELIYAQAQQLAALKRTDEAIQTYDKVVNHPNLPASYDSLILFGVRSAAVESQFDIEWVTWNRINPDDTVTKSAARDQVIKRRQQFADLVGEDSSQLLMMDGKIALSDHRPEIAADKFEQLLKLIGNASVEYQLETLLYSADALDALGQSGSAYQRLEEAYSITGGRYQPVIERLIQIDLKAGRIDNAQNRLNTILRNNADDQWAIETYRRIELIKSGGVSADQTNASDDPVLVALLEAQRAYELNDDINSTRDILAAALSEHPEDIRLLRQLAMIEQRAENTEDALIYVMRGLAVNPENQNFLVMQAQLNGDDLRDTIKKIVALQTDLEPVVRYMNESNLMRQFGFDEEAETAFQEAVSLNPDHPNVFDAVFSKALFAENWEEADRLVVRAREINLDRVNGATYEGRLRLKQGDASTAIALFLQASEGRSWDSSVWRFLAIAYRKTGNYTESIDAFEQAIQRRDDDIATLREYASLLYQIGENKKALQIIRLAKKAAPTDPAINQMYLDLEGRFGDRNTAITQREKLYQRDAEDVSNALSLTELYLADRNYDKADEILTTLTPATFDQQIAVSQYRARWHIMQGNTDDAIASFTNRINDTLTNPQREAVYLTLGQMLMGLGDDSAAINAFTNAQLVQDSLTCRGDRALGDFYTNRGDPQTALQHYLIALDAIESDPEFNGVKNTNDDFRRLSLRVIDLYLRDVVTARNENQSTDNGSNITKDNPQAQLNSRLEKHIGYFGVSVDTYLLNAVLTEVNGNLDEAKRLYNQSVQKYPEERRAYLFRARFRLARVVQDRDMSLVQGLESDVNRAMQINASDIEPLLVLVQLYQYWPDQETGGTRTDFDRLSGVLNRILEIQPRDISARSDLVRFMMNQQNHAGAAALILDAINLGSNREIWLAAMGEVMIARGDTPEEYLPQFKQAYEISPSPIRLSRLVKETLNAGQVNIQGSPEDAQQYANDALQYLANKPDWVAMQPTLEAQKALALHMLNKNEESHLSLIAAYEAINTLDVLDSRYILTREWFEYVAQIVGLTAVESFYLNTAKTETPNPIEGFLLGRKLIAPTTQPLSGEELSQIRNTGRTQLEHVRTSLPDSDLPENVKQSIQIETGNLLGSLYYNTGSFNAAADAWQWTLEADPTDFQANNNLAYTLADQLDDPAGAVAPAQRAFDARPNDPNTLDTFGYILWCNQRYDEAEEYLRRSIRINPKATNHKHLGQVLIARQIYTEARSVLETTRQYAAQTGANDMVQEIDILLDSIP